MSFDSRRARSKHSIIMKKPTLLSVFCPTVFIRLYVGRVGEGMEANYRGYEPIEILTDSEHWALLIGETSTTLANTKKIEFAEFKSSGKKITWFAITDKKGFIIRDFSTEFPTPLKPVKGEKPMFGIGGIMLEWSHIVNLETKKSNDNA